MPDDQIVEEVAEPEKDPLIEDTESNESAAFASESDEDEDLTGLEQVPAGKKAEPEKKEEPEGGEKKTETDGSESEDEQNTDTETEGEEDEDIKRGNEILAAQKAQQEEQEKAEKEAEQQRQQQDTPAVYNLSEESFTEQDVRDKFIPAIPKNLLPTEPFKLEDGTVIDFKNVMEEYPEIVPMISVVANHMVRRMIQGGVVMNAKQYEADKQNFTTNLANQDFINTVTHPINGVPEARQIVNSDEYKQWFEKQSDAIKALRISGNPWDYIKLLKRYQNKELTDQAKKDAEEADRKRQGKKEVVDGVFKAQKKSGAKPKKTDITTGLGSPEDEDEAFEKDDKNEFF